MFESTNWTLEVRPFHTRWCLAITAAHLVRAFLPTENQMWIATLLQPIPRHLASTIFVGNGRKICDDDTKLFLFSAYSCGFASFIVCGFAISHENYTWAQLSAIDIHHASCK